MSLIETCWMITSKVSLLAFLVIMGICLGIFVCPYLKQKKQAAAVTIVYIASMLVLYLVPFTIDNFFAYLIGVAAACLVMYAGDRRNIYQKIFLAVTFFSIRSLTVAMAGQLGELMTEKLVFRDTLTDRVWVQYGWYVGTRVLDLFGCFVFIAGALWLINRAYVRKKDEMDAKEMVMLMMPSLVGVIGHSILQHYMTVYENDTGRGLIDTYGFYGALSFLYYLISLIAILVMIVMFQNWKTAQEKQAGQELVLNQISDMKKHIAGVEKLYQDIRSLRHDMGNHIQTLEHLVACQHADAATEYLGNLKEQWNEISPAIKTGSPVTDVILIEKKREAEERQIHFLSEFHYPENTKINVFDLSVILNNALDNCIENVNGAHPYIKISSFRNHSVFMIIIENSYVGTMTYDEDLLPETTKQENGHGLGLRNIRRVAQMYMGDLSIEQHEEAVVVSIMLQVE